MAKDLPLTLAFLHQKPLAAGRELATMSAEDAAMFLDAVPTRSAAPVLALMGAWPAAGVLGKMSATSAAAILSSIDYLDAAAILRSCPATDRERVLSDLPTKLRRDFEATLVFPDSTVGAHMTTAFMTLTEQHVVGDAIELIQRSAMVNPDVLLIVDADRKLAGCVTAASLLRHAATTPLGEIMDSGIEAISARSRVSAVDNLNGWDHYSAVPVVSRQKRVIGLLTRKAVSCATGNRSASPAQPVASIPISMLDAFIASIIGLTQALVGTETSPTFRVRDSNE